MDRIRPKLNGTPALPRRIPRLVGPNTSSLSTSLLQALRRTLPPVSCSPGPDAPFGCCRIGSIFLIVVQMQALEVDDNDHLP